MDKIKQPSYDRLTTHQKRLVDKAVSHGVPRYYAVCVMAATANYRYISFALGLALTQQESTFRNVFGHDPTLSLPESWKGGHVNYYRYFYYRLQRKLGLGMQGVGPEQLTWWETQDYADKRGGCWKIYVNIDVGCQTLAARIRDLGYVKGIERYNGTGPLARAYSASVRRRAATWRMVLGT